MITRGAAGQCEEHAFSSHAACAPLPRRRRWRRTSAASELAPRSAQRGAEPAAGAQLRPRGEDGPGAPRTRHGALPSRRSSSRPRRSRPRCTLGSSPASDEGGGGQQRRQGDGGSEDGLERPLVVGYVSPDLFTHSVSYFAEAPLAHHDPRRRARTACKINAQVYGLCCCTWELLHPGAFLVHPTEPLSKGFEPQTRPGRRKTVQYARC